MAEHFASSASLTRREVDVHDVAAATGEELAQRPPRERRLADV